MAPHRLLRRLLEAVSSRAAADAAFGDIVEELQERRGQGRTPRPLRLWLNLRTVDAIVAAMAAAAPATFRTTALTVRDAWRSLRRAPLPSLFIFVILAVAISAATVTFSVADAVVLQPLPFDHSERIVTISRRLIDIPIGISVPQFEAIRTSVPGLDSIGVWRGGSESPVTIDATPETVRVGEAMSDGFRVLSVSPILGRVWNRDDEAHRLDEVAVISDHLWQARFARAPSVIGRTIRMFGRSYEIIGVLPDEARSLGDDRFVTDIIIPFSRQLAYEASRPNGWIPALARLRPGVSIDEFTREINTAVAGVPRTSTDQRMPDGPLTVVRLDAQLIGDAREWLLLLLGVVGLVLLIACVNVANVLLAQSAGRARDLAVRASFGASRRQLAASVLAESLFLSLSAGATALLFSTWAIHAAKAALPQSLRLFREGAIALNARVLTAGAVAAVATGLLFGLVPAWQASRTSVATLLKEGGLAATARRGWRSGLLVAEVGAIGVLLVVSTLFISSFVRVNTLDVGFDRSHLVAVKRLFDYHGTIGDLKSRLASLPGVTGVAAAGPTSLPYEMGSGFGGVWIDAILKPSHAPDSATSVDADLYQTTSDFFDVTGIRFLRGSAWAAGIPPAPRPMVLDDTAARELFGARDPIGQLVHAHSPTDQDFTVVGIVQSARSRAPDETSRPIAYYAQAPTDPPASAGFLVRASDPAAVAPLVQSVAASVLAPGSAKPEVYVVDDAFRTLTEPRRFNAALMSALGLFALAIGAAGIYAVMASIVAQQTKEIGVRVALGATARDIRRGVLVRTGRYVTAGLVLGLPAGWLIARSFASEFFEVTPSDTSIYLIVAATLGAVAFIAAIVPARRAARVDPVVSLRAS